MGQPENLNQEGALTLNKIKSRAEAPYVDLLASNDCNVARRWVPGGQASAPGAKGKTVVVIKLIRASLLA